MRLPTFYEQNLIPNLGKLIKFALFIDSISKLFFLLHAILFNFAHLYCV